MSNASNDSASERVLVCIAWPYAKTSTHVGQIVGSFLPGDIFARYHRMNGKEVLMVSGSDEHGTPIAVDADHEGISPREFVARYHAQILEIWSGWASPWISIPRRPPRITTVSRRISSCGCWSRATSSKTRWSRPTARPTSRFLPDRYVEGTCPYCGFTDARGDQCDNCGRTLDPTQLIDPRCRLCGASAAPSRFAHTEHFFLDLPKFEPQLRHWLRRPIDALAPERRSTSR